MNRVFKLFGLATFTAFGVWTYNYTMGSPEKPEIEVIDATKKLCNDPDIRGLMIQLRHADYAKKIVIPFETSTFVMERKLGDDVGVEIQDKVTQTKVTATCKLDKEDIFEKIKGDRYDI
jgi:hypothetical protein